MNQLWQLWRGLLTDKQCDRLIDLSRQYEPINATIGQDDKNKIDEGYRRSTVRWVSNNKEIRDLMWYHAEEANRNAFGFDISLIRDIQFTEYNADVNAKYDWHIDTFWGNSKPFDRKISVVVQLSDPNDYEGGEFELDRAYEQPVGFEERGSIFVFPSFLHHRVTPVTKGTRYSLVSWIEGKNFK
jgi:PKHD-type hydroxylase